MNLSRRELLRLGGVGLVGGIGGAIVDSWSPPLGDRVSLVVGNSDSEAHAVSVTILREERAEFSEAFAFDQRYELAADTDEGPYPFVRESNILPRVPYLVKLRIDGDPAGHFHFRPDCNGIGERTAGREPLADGIDIYITDDGTAEFGQNTCSGNDWRV